MLQQKIMSFIGKKPVTKHIMLTILYISFILLVGLMDFWSADLNLFIFYAFWVVFSALFIGTGDGIFASILASSLNYFVNRKYLVYDNPFILSVNLVIDLSLFLFITYLVVLLRQSLLKEKNLSRTDFLTGIGNRRYLMEILTARNAASGGEYSVAYLDIDRFNVFIEEAGLARADEMIRMTAQFIRKRYKDVYRFEENRFIVLFDEIDGETAFKKMNELRLELQKHLEMQKLPVTFSVGIVLVSRQGFKISAILAGLYKIVQNIKREGGNQVKFAVMK